MSEAAEFPDSEIWITWYGDCDGCGRGIEAALLGVSKEHRNQVWVRCIECDEITSLSKTRVVGDD